MAELPPIIRSLEDIAPRYPALLCDVWGVVHNGERAFPPPLGAAAAREQGAGGRAGHQRAAAGPDVVDQFKSLGVPDGAWDAIVTSGDVTRDLIAAGPRRVFHLGPERDLSIYDGLDVDLVEEFEASAVVCTGLFDDETENAGGLCGDAAALPRPRPAVHLRQSRHRRRARRPADLVRRRARARLCAARRPHADCRQAAPARSTRRR